MWCGLTVKHYKNLKSGAEINEHTREDGTWGIWTIIKQLRMDAGRFGHILPLFYISLAVSGRFNDSQ